MLELVRTFLSRCFFVVEICYKTHPNIEGCLHISNQRRLNHGWELIQTVCECAILVLLFLGLHLALAAEEWFALMLVQYLFPQLVENFTYGSAMLALDRFRKKDQK